MENNKKKKKNKKKEENCLSIQELKSVKAFVNISFCYYGGEYGNASAWLTYSNSPLISQLNSDVSQEHDMENYRK